MVTIKASLDAVPLNDMQFGDYLPTVISVFFLFLSRHCWADECTILPIQQVFSDLACSHRKNETFTEGPYVCTCTINNTMKECRKICEKPIVSKTLCYTVKKSGDCCRR
uniref:Uncharacterized protein n=1 Tax=Romanomermis culicivorax TaxID=13658 RepID=A0A915KWZ5_ROMCU